jgi:hypothetical protein
MDASFRETLVEGLRQGVAHTAAPVAQTVAEVEVWRRTGPGAWEGGTVKQPQLGYVMWEPVLRAASRDFAQALPERYPEHLDQVGLSGMRMRLRPEQVFSSLVRELWARHWPKTPSLTDVEEIAGELADFLHGSMVTIDYHAPVENFSMLAEEDELDLPTGTRIRRLDDEELTNLFRAAGDPPWMLHQYQFAFVGTFDAEKKLGPMPADEQSIAELPASTIRRTIVGMRCFKSGAIDYSQIRLAPHKFVPFPLGTHGRSGRSPHRTYKLKTEDITPLRDHLHHYVSHLDATLELASSRLFLARDGGTRSTSS